MPSQPEVNLARVRLGFADAVAKRFAFLEALGFQQVDRSATVVHYRKDDIEVRIWHEPLSYELDFVIARREGKYGITDLMRVSDPQAATRFRLYAASTEAGVMEGVDQLATLAERFGGAAFRGDSSFFLAMNEARGRWREQTQIEETERDLRLQAEEAFGQSDYRRAVELYERIRPQLTPAELKRLAIATRRRP